MADWAQSIVILLGGALALLGGIGAVRMPDVVTRMHASGKMGVLGVALALTATAIHFGDASTVGLCLVGIVLTLGTTALGTYLLVRAVHVSDVELWEETLRDELRQALDGTDEAAKPERDDPKPDAVQVP